MAFDYYLINLMREKHYMFWHDAASQSPVATASRRKKSGGATYVHACGMAWTVDESGKDIIQVKPDRRVVKYDDFEPWTPANENDPLLLHFQLDIETHPNLNGLHKPPIQVATSIGLIAAFDRWYAEYNALTDLLHQLDQANFDSPNLAMLIEQIKFQLIRVRDLL